MVCWQAPATLNKACLLSSMSLLHGVKKTTSCQNFVILKQNWLEGIPPLVLAPFYPSALTLWKNLRCLMAGVTTALACHQNLSRIVTKPTKWHVRSAKTQTPSLIRVFAVCLKKARILSYPLSTQRRLWLDWVHAQADMSLRWMHMPFRWFCHDAAQMNYFKYSKKDVTKNNSS